MVRLCPEDPFTPLYSWTGGSTVLEILKGSFESYDEFLRLIPSDSYP